MSNQSMFDMTLVSHIAWGTELKQDIIEVGPPSGSFIELPGPRRRPVRPYVELFAGPDGTVARIIHGDGAPLALALLISPTQRMLPLTEVPLALSARADGGVWALHRTSLVRYSDTGQRLEEHALQGMTLVGGKHNAVWVVGLDNAWFVSDQGQIQGPYAWQAGLNSTGSRDDALCALEKTGQRRVQCLMPDGQQRAIDLTPAPGPFEQLLYIDDQRALTFAGASFRRYTLGGMATSVMLQSAGLTNANAPFVSGQQETKLNLYLSNGTFRQFDLSSVTSAGESMRVIAVDDTNTLVYGRSQAVWYKGDQRQSSFVVDDARFLNDVFPHLWEFGSPRFAVAQPDGRLLLATTGPSGVALIGLIWKSTP